MANGGHKRSVSQAARERYLFALIVLRLTWKVAAFCVRGGEAAFDIAIASIVNLRRSV